jgi:hypothetical protein
MTFKSPNDLTRQLSASPQVHGCFAQAALQWALGRQLVMEDQDMVLALNDVAKKTRGGVSAILQTIVSAPGFATSIAAR